jgi:DNA-binding NarL/FixJ family response regulator
MQSITVAIADPDMGTVQACERMLQQDGDITVVGQAANCTELVTKLLALKPRILLFSLDLCSDAECSLLDVLRRDCPSTRVVLLADHPVEEEQLVQALATGARGYLDYETCERHLAKALHCVDRGEAWVPRRMLGKMMETMLLH